MKSNNFILNIIFLSIINIFLNINSSYLEQAPKEIKSEIISRLISGDSPEEIIFSLKSLANTNKEFYNLINSPENFDKIFRALAQKFNYDLSNPIQAIKLASVFNTNSAMNWLKIPNNLNLQNFNYETAKDSIKFALINSLRNDNPNQAGFLLNIAKKIGIKLDWDTQFTIPATNTWNSNFLNMAIYKAATNQNLAANYRKIIKFLISHGATGIDRTIVFPHENFRLTPLAFAVKNNNLELAKLLLDLGANPNAESQRGITPLMLAGKNRNDQMIYLLLQRGSRSKLPDLTRFEASFKDN